LTWATVPTSGITGGTAQGQVLINGVSNVPTWGSVDLADVDAVTGLLGFANMANLAAVSVLGRGSGTSGVMAAISAGVDGQVLQRVSSTSLAFGTINASISVNNSSVTLAKIANGSASSVLGRSAATAGVYADILSTADGQVLRRGAAGVIAFGAVDLADADAVTGLLPLTNLAGASGNTNKFLVSNGTDWAVYPGVEFTTNEHRWTAGIVNPEINQLPSATTGTNMYMTAQRGQAGPGGNLILSSGIGSTVDGNAQLCTGGHVGVEVDGSNNVVNLYGGAIGVTTRVQTQVGPSFTDFDISIASGTSGRYDIRYNGSTFISFARSIGNGMRLSFFGVTPTSRLADPGFMTATAGTSNDTIVSTGNTIIDDNFRDVVAKLNLLRGYLQTYGLCN
jgi:hypothetical protein